MNSSRHDYPVAYAFAVRSDGVITRYAHGLWPRGFDGHVVAVVIDSGTGTVPAAIRAAMTVTYLDESCTAAVDAAVDDHVAVIARVHAPLDPADDPAFAHAGSGQSQLMDDFLATLGPDGQPTAGEPGKS